MIGSKETKEMKEIYAVRRDNLRAYIRDHGGATSVAKALGRTNASTLSQLVGSNATRLMGEKSARDYERKLALPVGWFDVQRDALGRVAVNVPPADLPQAHIEPVAVERSTLLDEDRLQFCLDSAQGAPSANKLKPGKLMAVVTLAYDSSRPVGDDLKRLIERLVQLTL